SAWICPACAGSRLYYRGQNRYGYDAGHLYGPNRGFAGRLYPCNEPTLCHPGQTGSPAKGNLWQYSGGTPVGHHRAAIDGVLFGSARCATVSIDILNEGAKNAISR